MKNARILALFLALALVLGCGAFASGGSGGGRYLTVNANCLTVGSASWTVDGPVPADPALTDCVIEHETEFGGVYILMTIDDFNAMGFAYGDSVDVTFSNGYTLTDLPYYNGYYTGTGVPLLVAYPGYPYIKACINNGDDL